MIRCGSHRVFQWLSTAWAYTAKVLELMPPPAISQVATLNVETEASKPMKENAPADMAL